MSLARTQREFLQVILGGDEPVDAGLAVYHRGALAARVRALAAAYPVVARLVGAPWFTEAASRYARAHASTSGDLHAYGGDFARFLEDYPPAQALGYLPDVARLEWAVHESQFAADVAAFDYAALGSVSAEAVGAVRIALPAGVRLVDSAHPILAIWQANQPGRDGTPDRTEGPDRVVVRRVGPDVEPAAVEAGEWALLQAFARGEPLEAAAARCEREGAALAPALRRLAALEVLGGFEVSPP